MRIVLFSLFGFNVYSHGVFLILGIVLGATMLYRLAIKEGLKVNSFLTNIIGSVLAGIIASRILYYLLNLSSYQNIYQLPMLWQGGLVSFAGFIAGGVVFVFMLKKQGANIPAWANLSGIAFPLALAIGRIGCVLNGEVGKRSKSAIAYYGHMPITALEIYLGIAIFAINFSLYLYLKKSVPKYLLFFNFIALYSFARIFIDAFRADKNLPIGINLSQLTSLVILLIAIFSYSFYYYQTKWRENAPKR